MEFFTESDHHNKSKRHITPFFLLFLLIFFSYSNTFKSSWQFDDYGNITKNPAIQIDNLKPETLYKTLFFSNDGEARLSRPLPRLTLALNWYFGKNNVFGYHVVNFAIHLFTAFILYLTILNLYRSHKFQNFDRNSAFFIALLSASIWAIHPIQIQAVTYIVQRMASMAALFYIISLFCYIKGRINNKSRWSYFILSFCCFIASVASKENAATLPIAVILLEILFFQDLGNPKTRKFLYYSIAFCGVMVIIGSIVISLGRDFSDIFEGYQKRPFNMKERLLTEPRVIIFYLSQIIYPISSRFSIDHQFSLSKSLFEPWTTLPAILIILALIISALTQIRKRPFFSFAILFYFLNHIIESTVIPLEIAFEHRNYLPSFFLFVPFAAGFYSLIKVYDVKNRFLKYFLTLSMISLLICLGISTYTRNSAWRSEKTLWMDALGKNPDSGRSMHNVAWGVYEKNREYSKAMALYQKALSQTEYHRKDSRAVLYNNMAGIYLLSKDYENTIKFLEKAIEVYPEFYIVHYRKAKTLLKIKNYSEAEKTAEYLTNQDEKNATYLNLRGLINLKMNKTEEALKFFQKSLKLQPERKDTLAYLGATFKIMKNYKRSLWFFKYATSLYPKNPDYHIWLISLYIDLGNYAASETEIEKLFKLIGPEKTLQRIKRLSNDPESGFECNKKFFTFIKEKIRRENEKQFESLEKLVSKEQV